MYESCLFKVNLTPLCGPMIFSFEFRWFNVSLLWFSIGSALFPCIFRVRIAPLWIDDIYVGFLYEFWWFIALIFCWIWVFLCDFFWGGGGVRLRFYGLMIFFCLVSVVFPACILMIYCLIVLIFNRICVILCDSKMLHSLVIVDLPIPSCLVPLKQYWSCWFFIKLSLKAPLFALGEHWCNYIYFQYLYQIQIILLIKNNKNFKDYIFLGGFWTSWYTAWWLWFQLGWCNSMSFLCSAHIFISR